MTAVIGETWAYYILGSIVEVALLLTIARVALTWRGGSGPRLREAGASRTQTRP